MSATIPISGGSLSLTAADGTLFTLTVPDGALLSSAQISLTAVSEIEGFPLSGGLDAGVHIEPEGLHFFKAAALTLQLPANRSTEGTVGFGYQGSGEAFHLVPWTLEGQTVTLHVMHLSGYGAGKGTAQDLAAVHEQYTCSVAERMLSRIAEILAGQNAITPGMQDAMAEILTLWRVAIVQPELEAARSDDARIHCAIYHFLQWYEQLIVLDLEDRFPGAWDAFEQDVTEILRNAIERASDRCIADNDPYQAMRMLRWTSLLWMLTGDEMSLDEVWDRVVACARFELEFDSTMVTSDYTRVYGAGIPVALDEGIAYTDHTGFVYYTDEPSAPGELVFKGQGPIEHIEFSGCLTPVENNRGGLYVFHAEIDLNVGPQESCECLAQSGEPASEPDQQPSAQSLTMKITFMGPIMRGPCLPGCGDDICSSVAWMAGWIMTHGPPSPLWEIRDWEIMPRRSPLFAVKRFGQAIPAVEVTTFKLWHMARPPDAPPPDLTGESPVPPPEEDTD